MTDIFETAGDDRVNRLRDASRALIDALFSEARLPPNLGDDLMRDVHDAIRSLRAGGTSDHELRVLLAGTVLSLKR